MSEQTLKFEHIEDHLISVDDKDGDVVGFIQYYDVIYFEPEDNTRFTSSELRQIADYMDSLQEKAEQS